MLPNTTTLLVQLGLCLGWKGQELVVSEEGGREGGMEGRGRGVGEGGREGGRGGREGGEGGREGGEGGRERGEEWDGVREGGEGGEGEEGGREGGEGRKEGGGMTVIHILMAQQYLNICTLLYIYYGQHSCIQVFFIFYR